MTILSFERYRAHPGETFIGHSHQGLHWCWVLQGGFIEERPDASLKVSAGTVRISPPGARHSLRFGATGGVCLLLSANSDQAPDDCRVEPASGKLDPSPLIHEVERGDDVSNLIVECWVEAWATARAHRATPTWLGLARARLLDAIEDPPALSELAALSGVHRSHLCAAFKAHFGCTPGAFVRRQRVARACQLVRQSAMPLADIAACVGFADQSHMTHAIRRRTGNTPARMRCG